MNGTMNENEVFLYLYDIDKAKTSDQNNMNIKFTFLLKEYSYSHYYFSNQHSELNSLVFHYSNPSDFFGLTCDDFCFLATNVVNETPTFKDSSKRFKFVDEAEESTIIFTPISKTYLLWQKVLDALALGLAVLFLEKSIFKQKKSET